MHSAESYRLSGFQAHSLIKANLLTVEQYAQSLLSRQKERDPAVQAWAYLEPELVLKQARELDEITPEKRGPLHGIAIGVKDVMSTKDMPTRYNSPIHHNDLPQLDASSVAILRHAGALIMGKTTTTEFAAINEGPKTCNPHDPLRTPGGSSSGSGAAVADMQVAVGLGTQTGGSVIRPSSFVGVYGMKPTWNAISPEGQKVFASLLDTFGFLARSVEDLQLLADVFALRDDEPDSPIQLRHCKFAVIKTVVWPKAGPGTRAAMDLAVELLQHAGASVEEVMLSSEFDDLPLWQDQVLTGEGGVSFYREYYSSRQQLSEGLVELVEDKRYSRKDFLRACDSIGALRPKIDDIANRYTAIITPSAIDEAPVGIGWTGSEAFNSIWTALHTPVINIPGFQGENGMPIGISIVAARYHDKHLLRVAEVVGPLFASKGGWKSEL